MVPGSQGRDLRHPGRGGSEFAKRYPGVGGLLASLPLVAVLSILWAWRENTPSAKIASLSDSTFWFVLPLLPVFLLIRIFYTKDGPPGSLCSPAAF